jgi:hypothetical protein
MSDGRSQAVPKPKRRSKRWTSFVATPTRGRISRGLEEESNPYHRARVEHSQDTILIHLSDEDGRGWTTLAVDRKTREWSVAQRVKQMDAAVAACELLYE